MKDRLERPLAAYQLYQVARQASVLIIGILLAKFGLDAAEIGRYESLFFLGNTLALLWLSGLINSFMAEVPKEQERAPAAWGATFYWVVLLFTLATALLAYLLEGSFSAIFLKSGQIGGYRLFLLYYVLSTPVWVFPQQLLIGQQARYLLRMAILQGLLPVLAVGYLLWQGQGVEGALWALCGVFALFHLQLLIYLGKALWRGIDRALLRRILSKAMPLFLYAFFGSLAIWFDNWLVQRAFPDEASFAIFRYGAREFPLAVVLAAALSTALIPSVARNLQGGMEEIKRSTLRYFHLLLPLVILLFFLSPWLFEKVYNPEFRSSALVFNAYLLITASRLLLPQTVLMGLGANRYLLRASIYECLVNILASIALLAAFGLEGIALGTAIAFTFEKLYYMVVLYRNFSIYPSSYIPMKWLMFYSALMLTAFSLARWLFFGV